MAFSRRRRFFRGGRGLRRRGTQFSQARDRSGRQLKWESDGDVCWRQIGNVWPNIAREIEECNENDLYIDAFRTVIPQNVTRGIVGLKRAHVWLGWHTQGFPTNQQDLARNTIHWTLQLVPIHGGVIVNEAVLNDRDNADLESNRIIARDVIVLGEIQHTQVVTIDAVNQLIWFKRIDIKSMRTWDRSQFALCSVAHYFGQLLALDQAFWDIRMLIASYDGL